MIPFLEIFRMENINENTNENFWLASEDIQCKVGFKSKIVSENSKFHG